MALQDRLSGAGLKPLQAANGQKPSVVSVGGKAREKLALVRIRETNESEPVESSARRADEEYSCIVLAKAVDSRDSR